MMLNEYGGDSTPWPIPQSPPDSTAGPPLKSGEAEIEVQDLIAGPERPSVKDVVAGALQHLNKHPDAALLAYRLLSQRFAISG